MTCHICAKQNCIGECEPKIAKPAHEWVGLTEAEKYALADDVARRGVPVFEAICEAEAKLREKNDIGEKK